MTPLHAAVPRRAALYLRVSSIEQTVENQLADLEAPARVRGFEIVERYDETGSAVKKRPRYEAMMQDAKRGRFDVLLVWALDRFGRTMTGNIADALELDRVGVELISHREPWLDTSGPIRGLLLAIFSWVAEEERRVLIARTHAGLDRARRQGKRLGRPRTIVDVPRARRLRGEGRSLREVARLLAVPRSVLARALAEHGPETSPAEPPDPPEIGGRT